MNAATAGTRGSSASGWAPAPEWWNVATFKEPFRLEGKKTPGYEIAEQSGWRLPDVIFYPTGGGTGLVGMARAFEEMTRLGWIRGPLPRLIAVQSGGCAPVVRAWERGEAGVTPWTDAVTVASGLRVPSPFADRLILRSIRASDGLAVAVEEAAHPVIRRWPWRLIPQRFIQVIESCRTVAIDTQIRYGSWAMATQR